MKSFREVLMDGLKGDTAMKITVEEISNGYIIDTGTVKWHEPEFLKVLTTLQLKMGLQILPVLRTEEEGNLVGVSFGEPPRQHFADVHRQPQFQFGHK